MVTYVWVVYGWVWILEHHQKDMYAQKRLNYVLNIFDNHSICNNQWNWGGGTYMAIWWPRESPLWQWTLRYLYELQNYKEKWLHARFGVANHLTLLMCFVSYKKWVLKEKIIHSKPAYLTLLPSSRVECFVRSTVVKINERRESIACYSRTVEFEK